MKSRILSVVLMLITASPAAAAPQLVTLDSSSPLISIRIMVKAGSAMDPAGREGLAALTAQALLDGGYGPDEAVVTKEELARKTQAWGRGARPSVSVTREVSVLSMTVPRDALATYASQILRPLLLSPRFEQSEIDRLRQEARTNLTGRLRYEAIELLGLEALDEYIFEGTSYGHAVSGSVQGLEAITPEEIRGFFAHYYREDNMIVGLSTEDEDVRRMVLEALSGVGSVAGEPREPGSVAFTGASPISGRHAVVVRMPDSGATGVHFGFPLPIDRTHEDFWPLWVANVHFGTHRDSHGLLYTLIRQERGYNYGDYSYIEHFAWRPYALFPPFNTPRREQYFSVWIRPVATEHSQHLLKAAIYELQQMIEDGLTDDEVAASRNKARVLYLNYAETADRLLAARMDDAWYGMERGYLDHYLERIEAVTTEQVNAAIREYLSTEDLKILIVAEADRADALAASLREDGIVYGKGPAEYQLRQVELEDGSTVWQVPDDRIDTLRRDAVWASYPLDLETVLVVDVDQLFETGRFITPVETSR
jgi:zinc protease